MAFPGEQLDWTQLTEDQDRHAMAVIFEQLDAFLADKELNVARDPSFGEAATD